MIKSILLHPLTRSLDLDDPRTTLLRRRIIQDKIFLKNLYKEWYQDLTFHIPKDRQPVLEIGSGSGFLDEYVPDLITSDILYLPWLSLVMDAIRLPFKEGALRAIAMNNVLHHLTDVNQFFTEAARCLSPGGVILMVEPWVTKWSTFIYTRFHHEPFEPTSKDWSLATSQPLSSANGAIPWILFERDQDQFRNRFPQLEIVKIRLMMPFRYLLSGGVSMRALMPGWTFSFWRRVERMLEPWMEHLAMFALIVLEKRAQ